jgi:hypothetical protein
MCYEGYEKQLGKSIMNEENPSKLIWSLKFQNLKEP